MPKPSKNDYLWPVAQFIASVANIIGQGMSILKGDANDTPAFKTGLATSALYAAGAAYRIKQVYDERSVPDEIQAQTASEIVSVPAAGVDEEEKQSEPNSVDVVIDIESAERSADTSPHPSPRSFVERENERRLRRTQTIDFAQHQPE